jgi:glucokinase
MTTGPAALGIDVGGTKVAGGIVAADGTVVATARRATPGASVADTEDAIVAVVDELAGRYDGELVGVGVGAAGWFDRTGDTVLFSPHLAWRNSTLRQDLATRLQRPLWVGNDADAAAWAEYRYGAARGADLALMITLGTGIGGGIVLDGRLRRGSHGVAGEWGHMRVVPDGRLCACGNRGCWEQYASGTALGQTAREVARTSPAAAARLLERVDCEPDRLTGEDVARAAAEGDPLALELVTEVGVWLGQGIADLAAVLDPEVVVIGGGVSKLGEMVLAPARDRLDRALPGRGFRPGPRIAAAELGPKAGLVGAADLVRQDIAALSDGTAAMTLSPSGRPPRPGAVPPSR